MVLVSSGGLGREINAALSCWPCQPCRERAGGFSAPRTSGRRVRHGAAVCGHAGVHRARRHRVGRWSGAGWERQSRGAVPAHVAPRHRAELALRLASLLAEGDLLGVRRCRAVTARGRGSGERGQRADSGEVERHTVAALPPRTQPTRVAPRRPLPRTGRSIEPPLQPRTRRSRSHAWGFPGSNRDSARAEADFKSLRAGHMQHDRA